MKRAKGKELRRPASPVGRIRAALARLGWTLHRSEGPGPARFHVIGTDGKGGRLLLAEFVLEARPGRAMRSAESIVPAFRLKVLPRRPLSAGERRGLDLLAADLCLVAESWRTKAPAGSAADARAEAHEGAKGTDLLLRTTLACNQRCPFCFIPLSRRRIDPTSLELELDGLARRLGPGGTLNLSGGEPLVEPRLLDIVARGRAKGIRRFVLQTNMIGLDKPGLLDKLIELGVRHYFVSFHSHEPAVYDRLTGSRRLFAKAVRGLVCLLCDPRCGVTLNVVICGPNYRGLPEMMEYLANLRVGHRGPQAPPLEVYLSISNGVGIEKAPGLAVDLAKAAPFVRRAIEVCEREGLRVQPFGAESSMPPCVLARPGDYASRRPLSQDRVRYAEEFSKGDGLIGRAKRPSCRQCPYDARCLGVPVEYARLFGLGALKPPEA